LNYRRRGITHKKANDIQNMAKVWNQENPKITRLLLSLFLLVWRIQYCTRKFTYNSMKERQSLEASNIWQVSVYLPSQNFPGSLRDPLVTSKSGILQDRRCPIGLVSVIGLFNDAFSGWKLGA
jgi:hypothetical protein